MQTPSTGGEEKQANSDLQTKSHLNSSDIYDETPVPIKRKVIATVIGLLLIVGTVFTVNTLIKLKPEPAKVESSVQKQNIDVIEVTPSSVQVEIKAQGDVQPRWKTQITAEVSGKVRSVSDKLLVGAAFNEGDVFATIDNANYLAALQQAKASLANAEQVLQEERQRSKRATADWKRSGFNGEASELVRRIPQLKAAKAQLSAAKSQVEQARRDLTNTKIKAPYDGVVLQRTVNLGDYLSAGQTLGAVYATDKMEVVLPLRPDQWQQILLSSDQALQKSNTVSITSDQSKQTWSGTIARFEQEINPQNRWRNLIVEIHSEPGQHPISGLFVQAIIYGKTLNQVIALPESALSRQESIWIVDANNQLEQLQADIVYTNDKTVYLNTTHLQGNIYKVVTKPSNSLLVGTAVTPQIIPHEVHATKTPSKTQQLTNNEG